MMFLTLLKNPQIIKMVIQYYFKSYKNWILHKGGWRSPKFIFWLVTGTLYTHNFK
jgi:hypothetical protein